MKPVYGFGPKPILLWDLFDHINWLVGIAMVDPNAVNRDGVFNLLDKALS